MGILSRILVLAVAAVAVQLEGTAPAATGRAARPGVLELDSHSEFSHIRVRRQGNLRTLLFVRDAGEEVVQSIVNLKKPYELLNSYARAMFASYLLKPQPERVLIVGLGGGAMVHFLEHYDPDTKVDVVEIDPAVVQIADRYFDVRSGGNIHVITGDGLRYLAETEKHYGVIYMDAFLKPSADTDATGAPLAMKTAQFYKQLQKRLTARGVVVFNVNPHRGMEADLRAIRGAFAQSYVFHTADTNLIVLATTVATREEPAALRARAKELDRRLKATFSFQELLRGLAR
jgi:spermidine synthase